MKWASGVARPAPNPNIRTVYFFQRVAKVPLKEVNSANVWLGAAFPCGKAGLLTTTACQRRMPIFSAVDEESEDLGGNKKGKERKGSLAAMMRERGRREILGEIREHHRPLAFCGRTHIIHEPIRAERERHREAEREAKEKKRGGGRGAIRLRL